MRESDFSKVLFVRISDRLHSALVERARAEDRSLSSLTRLALLGYVEPAVIAATSSPDVDREPATTMVEVAR